MEAAGDDGIKVLAYHIWEREGRPDGRAEEHWSEAEREVAKGAAGDGDGAARVAVTTADDPTRKATTATERPITPAGPVQTGSAAPAGQPGASTSASGAGAPAARPDERAVAGGKTPDPAPRAAPNAGNKAAPPR